MAHDEPTPKTGAARAAAVYRHQQVNNLTQQELLLMLYDGAIRFCEEAKAAITEQDFNGSYHNLVRARDIVTELWSILNPAVEHEVVTNLSRLYDFCIHSITEANFTRDVALIDGTIGVLGTLREAWAELDFHVALTELQEAGLPQPEQAPTAGAAPRTCAAPELAEVEAASGGGLSITG